MPVRPEVGLTQSHSVQAEILGGHNLTGVVFEDPGVARALAAFKERKEPEVHRA